VLCETKNLMKNHIANGSSRYVEDRLRAQKWYESDRPRDMLTKTLSLVKYNLKSQKTMTMMMKMRTLSLYPRLINRKEKLKMVFNHLYPPNLRKRSNSLLYLHLLQNYQYSHRKIKSRTWNSRKRKSRKAFPL